MIKEMIPDDSKRILEIYKMGLNTRNATFETDVSSWADWNSKHLNNSRYTKSNKILGWAASSPVSTRKVYEGVVEVSVYIDTNTLGKGNWFKTYGKGHHII